MDKRHEWENAWRQKLSEATHRPSPELWERLEAGLPTAQKNSKRSLPLYRMVAAGLLILLAGATWMLVGPSGRGLLPQAEEGQALATRTDADEAGGQKALLPPPLIQPAPDSSEDPASQVQAAAAVPSAQDLKVAERDVAEKEPQRTASPSIRTEVVRPSQPLPVSAPKRTLPEQEMFRVDLNGSLVADSKAGNGLGGRMAETRSEKRSGFRLIEEEMDGDVRVLRIPGIGERIQQAIAQAEPRPRPLGLRSLQEAKNEFLEGLFEKNME